MRLSRGADAPSPRQSQQSETNRMSDLVGESLSCAAASTFRQRKSAFDCNYGARRMCQPEERQGGIPEQLAVVFLLPQPRCQQGAQERSKLGEIIGEESPSWRRKETRDIHISCAEIMCPFF